MRQTKVAFKNLRVAPDLYEKTLTNIRYSGCLFVLVYSLVGCDTVTNEYKTLEQARKERLFERGWLPDILPTTSTRIRTSNDLDVSTSKGEFYFNPNEYASFIEKLTPDSLKRSGCYQYSNNKSTWRFCCEREIGHCSYELSTF